MVASADREVLGFTTPIDLPFWEGGEVDGRVHVHASEAQWTQILHVPCIGDRPGFEAVSESSPYEFNGQTYRHHLGAAQFTVPIASTDGLVLTKHYDRLQGRQRARVWVDGEFAGVWDAYAENPDDRSSHARFPIDPALTNGKAEVRIAIDPPAGSPLWNWSSYSVEALRFIV